MTKQPEEGETWEWRAFGIVGEELAGQIHAHPIRMGIEEIQGEDLYLFSSRSDHNIKLRKTDGGWILKFKLLLSRAPSAAELYNESSAFVYSFPVAANQVEAAAALLRVRLAQIPNGAATANQLMDMLDKASPPVQRAEVQKVRSQFEIEGGWIELADVWFPKRRTQSVSIHSRDLATVEAMRARLAITEELEAMNYVEACRRWG